MRGRGAVAGFWSTVVCAITLCVAYLNKARCTGPPFTEQGRSLAFDEYKDSIVCYSDIQFLWLGRDINHHVFPYLHGAITEGGALVGGAVEYPVLSGLLMWLGALGAHTDADFLLHSALLLTPFALVTAWLLGAMAGRAALWWSAGPPLVLYAFHNWELPVVLTTVAAVFVVTQATGLSLRARGVIAAVLLGVGFCLKLYPGAFVIPLMAYVLTGGEGAGRRWDVRGALLVGYAAILTVLAVNLPFVIAGYPGWLASFTFQGQRRADITTNSIWYWGLRPLFAEHEEAFQTVVSVASPALVLASFGLAVWLGARRWRTTGVYPWVGVSGSMLCGFLLFHKVHSPQYTLWLIPFLVLLAVPWPAVVGYLIADVAIGVGVFRYFYSLSTGEHADLMEHVVAFGVWGRAALLVYFFWAFMAEGALRSKGSTEGHLQPSYSTKGAL